MDNELVKNNGLKKATNGLIDSLLSNMNDSKAILQNTTGDLVDEIKEMSKKIIIVGASSPFGRVVLNQAMDEGFHVIAFCDNVMDLELQLIMKKVNILTFCSSEEGFLDSKHVLSSVKVLKYDKNVEEHFDLMKDVSAICFCCQTLDFKLEVDLFSKSIETFIPIIKKLNIENIVAISSIGIGSQADTPLWMKWGLFKLLKNILSDMEKMEFLIKAIGIDYTIFRPMLPSPDVFNCNCKTSEKTFDSSMKLFVPISNIANYVIQSIKNSEMFKNKTLVIGLPKQ